MRAAQDRVLEEGGCLKSAGADWSVLARGRVTVPGRRAGDKGGPSKARAADGWRRLAERLQGYALPESIRHV